MSRFRKFVASLLIATNTVYPVVASASPYFYRVPLPTLKSRTGGQLAVVHTDPSNTTSQTMPLGGAILRVAPSDIDFGSIAVTQSSPVQTVTLYNLGGQSLVLGTLSASSQFAVTDSCDGVVVPPLGNCQVNVNFAPTQLTTTGATGKLSVPFSASGMAATTQVTLAGMPLRPPAGATAAASLAYDAQQMSVTNGVAAMQFADAIINQQSWQKSFQLTSSGDAPLSFGGLRFEDNDGSFAAATDCPASLPVGQSCTVTVTFAPVKVGSKKSTLVVDTNAYTGNSLPVNLTGQALEVYPIYGAASTQSVSFGELVQGAAGLTKVVTIANSGTAAMTVGTPSFSGQAAGLSIAASTCDVAVPAGGSCTISVALATTAVTDINATLDVPHNGRLTPTSPVHIPVTGSVIAQTRTLSYAATLDWGSADVNVAATRTLAITNTGNSAVSGITAATSSPFSVGTSNCAGQTLQPGSSCTITFSLTSGTNGPVSRAATISATGLTSPAPALSLTAAMQTRTVSAPAPASYAFGLQTTQAWSDTEYLTTLTNTGNVTLKPYVAGRGTDNTLSSSPWVRVSTDTCAAGVAPGATCQFGFQVKPTSTSSQSASVTIYPDTGMTGSAQTATITATGTVQNYSVSTSALAFGTVGSLQYVDQVVTVTNTSAAGTAVTGYSGITLTQPTAPTSGATLSVPANTCGSSIASGGSCSFTVRLTGSSYADATPLDLTGGAVSFYYSGARSTANKLPMSGTLVGSVLTVAANSSDFGDIPVGVATASAPRRVLTITNTGRYPVTYSTYSMAGGTLGLTEDTSVTGRCVANSAVPAGGSCTLTFYSVPGSTATAGSVSQTVTAKAVNLGSTVALNSPVAFTGRYIAPTIATNTSAIDFGTVGEKTTVTRTFTFQTTHGGAASWSSASITGAGYTTTVAGCSVGTDVTASQTCTVTVQFAPGAFTTTSMPGKVDLRFNVGGTVTTLATVTFAAQVEKSAYVIDYNDLAWGDVPTQTAGTTRYAVVRNASNSAVYPFTGSRSLAAPFSLSTATSTYAYQGANVVNCTGLTQLNPGQQCYVAVALSGVTGATGGAGAYNGNLTLISSTTDGGIAIPVSANFLKADPQAAAQVVFPNPTPSTTSHTPDMTLTITNNGGGRLYWTANPSQSYQFQTTGNFWMVRANNTAVQNLTTATVSGSTRCEEMVFLEPGASCSLTVRFTPTGAAGAKTGTLTLSSLNPDTRTLTVALSGTAQAGSVYINQTSLDYGNQLVGSTTTQGILIGNGGDTALGIRNIQRVRADGTTAAYAAELTAAHDCPTSLQPGQECHINVTFAPDRNLDWGTLTNKEVLQFEHYTNGAWSTVQVPLNGVGYGATLVVDRQVLDLGTVERTTVAQDYTAILTFTANGQAPVRILSFAPTTLSYLETYAGGTCATGMTLQPGSTCTMYVRNRADYSGYALGQVTKQTQQVFTINGTFKTDTGATQSDRTVQLLASATIVNPTTLVEVNPRAVSSRVATPASVFGTDLRAGAVLSLDGQALNATLVGSTELRITIPAGLASGSHTVTVRNMDGRNITASASFTAADFALSTATTTDVHTVSYDRPYEMRSAGVGHAAALDDGREIFVDKSGNVRLYDTAGHLVASAAVSASGTVAAIHASASGATVTLGWVSSMTGTWDCGYYSCTYYGHVYLGQQTFTVGASTLTAGSASNIQIWSVTGTSTYPTLTVNGLDIARSGTQTLMAYSYSVAGVGTTAAVRVWNGATAGSAYAMPASTGSTAAVGTALANNVAYVRYGNQVTTYLVSGTALSGGSSYQYAGSLDGTASGLAFNAGTAELISACYGDHALCVIPTASDALGAATMLSGNSASGGYNDGTYADALFSIGFVGPHPSGAMAYQSGTPNATRVINVSGMQQRAVLTASATSVDFGQVAVGSSATRAVVLGNSGSQNLSLQSVGTTGNFAANHNCPAELAPGAQCTVNITASPSSPDTQTGTLSIVSNSAYTSAGTISLQVVGGGSRAAFAASPVTVSGTYKGTPGTAVAQVTNTGTTNMTLTGVTGLNAPVTLTGNTCSNVAPQAACQLTFSVATDTLGTSTSTVTTAGALVNGTATVNSNVTGAVARWSTTSVTFKAGSGGSSSVTLYNDGNIAANFSGLAGASAPFSADMSGCTNVAAGGSCSVTIVYNPSDSSAVSQSGITVVGANANTNTLTLASDASAGLQVVAGNKALVGAVGSLLQNGSVDDTSIGIGMPTPAKFFGTSYSTMYVGSNSYVTFGSGSSIYSSQTLTNPALPGIAFGAADNSFQRVYSTTGTYKGVAFQRIRYEGNGSTSGTVGSPGIVVEITFYAPTTTEQYVEVNIGNHNRTTGVFGVKNSSSTGTVNGGTITANTTYVFKSDANGNNWTITKGAYIN